MNNCGIVSSVVLFCDPEDGVKGVKGVICPKTALLGHVSIAFRHCCFIAKSDIMFLGMLEHRLLHMIIASVIG
jgi:hypothetical protein